jgi:hypothetical protein
LTFIVYKNYLNINLYSRTVWEANLAKIRKHNLEADLGMHSYYMGMNVFGDLVRIDNKNLDLILI